MTGGNLRLFILPDDFISFSFDVQCILPCHHAIEIDRHDIMQVESHIVIAEFLMDKAGEDMLAGMVLHMVEAADPVDDTMDLRSFC